MVLVVVLSLMGIDPSTLYGCPTKSIDYSGPPIARYKSSGRRLRGRTPEPPDQSGRLFEFPHGQENWKQHGPES